MKVIVSSTLPLPADAAWELVKKSSTLLFVTRGLMGFRSVKGELPELWTEGKTEYLRIWLFNVIPAWKHQIHFEEISAQKKHLLTHESGGVVSTWNHLIKIKPESPQTTS